jgi:hypothetical protein
VSSTPLNALILVQWCGGSAGKRPKLALSSDLGQTIVVCSHSVATIYELSENLGQMDCSVLTWTRKTIYWAIHDGSQRLLDRLIRRVLQQTCTIKRLSARVALMKDEGNAGKIDPKF